MAAFQRPQDTDSEVLKIDLNIDKDMKITACRTLDEDVMHNPAKFATFIRSLPIDKLDNFRSIKADIVKLRDVNNMIAQDIINQQFDKRLEKRFLEDEREFIRKLYYEKNESISASNVMKANEANMFFKAIVNIQTCCNDKHYKIEEDKEQEIKL